MTQQSPQAWQQWKELIRNEYLVKDQESKVVAEVLGGHGFVISKQQLDRQLKSWGFRKNLSRRVWIFVDETIERRREAGKKSLVILYGRSVPAEKIEKQIERYKPLCKYTAPSPMSPDDDRIVQICTPRSRSPDPASLWNPWPDTLPWIEFSRSTISTLLAGIQLIPNKQRLSANLQITTEEKDENETQVALHEFARKEMTGVSKRPNFATSKCVMRLIIKRTVNIMIGSEGLASLLITSHSVDCMAARFDRIMPESYQGENLDRAIELVKGEYADQQAQLLKMLVYLVSNNLIMEQKGFDPRQGSSTFKDEAAFIGLFRMSGLANVRVLSELVRISKQTPTLVVLIEALFKAAVRVEAADIVRSLFTTVPQSFLNINSKVAFCTHGLSMSWGINCAPLQYALRIGAIDLVEALIAGGVDVNRAHFAWYPLAIAAYLDNHPLAIQLAQILLDHGAKMSYDLEGQSPIQLALWRGNFELVKLLLLRGEDAVSMWHIYKTHKSSCEIFGCRTMNYVLFEMNTVSSFAFAALADCSAYTSNDNANGRDESTLETHIISLMELLIAYSKDGINSLRQAGPDAMIVAAARGHIQVLKYLRSHQPDLAVTATNGKVSPLFAALTTNKVEACRLLLSWGVSTTVDECWRERWAHRMLSPWHFAVLHDSVELAELLLQQGVNLNPSCIVRSRAQWRKLFDFLPILSRDSLRSWFNTRVVNSPLLLAILLCHEEMATFLINAGALITTYDLIEATKLGQGELVAQMLSKIRGLSTYSKQQTAVVKTAIQHGQLSVVQQVMQEGVGANKLPVAAIFTLPTVAKIRQFLPTTTKDSRLYERFEERSYLETAILGGSTEVLTFALSLDLAYYDSGALCAAVSREAGTAAYSDAPLVQELVKRRDALEMTDSRIDPYLESTAVAIAVSGAKLDLIDHLVSGNGAQAIIHPATIPGGEYWSYDYHGQLRISEYECYLEKYGHELDRFAKPDLCLTGFARWRGWHSTSVIRSSPILIAIKQHGLQNRHALSEQLLDRGFPVDPHTLVAAIRHQFPDALVAEMIANCNIIEAVSKSNPLFIAASNGSLRIVKTLLAHGASIIPTISATNYGSPLAAAARNGHLEIVQFLLENRANTEHDIYSHVHWQTALQGAAENGHAGVVRCLLAHGADVNAPRNPFPKWHLVNITATEETALEVAAKTGRLDIVALLLNHRVSIISITGRGRVQYLRAILLATENGHTAIAQMLWNARQPLPEDEEVWKELRDHPYHGYSFFVHPAEYVDDTALIETICRIIELYGVCSQCKWWKGNEATCAKLNAALEISKGKMEGKWNPSICARCEQERERRDTLQESASDDEWSLEEWDDSSEDDQDSSEDEGDCSTDDGSKSMLARAASGVDIEMHDGTLSTSLDISDWSPSGYQEDQVATVYEDVQDGYSSSACQGGVITQADGLFNDHDNDEVIIAEVQEVPEQEQDGEAERRQRILADMRGEREMGFEPMEWGW